MNGLPTLQHLLRNVNFASVAREIGRPRGFVWRLALGQPMRDTSALPALARALNLPETFVRQVVASDLLLLREREEIAS